MEMVAMRLQALRFTRKPQSIGQANLHRTRHSSAPLSQHIVNAVASFHTGCSSPQQASVRRNTIDYGSVRKEWRSYVEHLQTFPRLQRIAFETAAFFTKPNELEFNLPRDFHARYRIEDKIGEGAFGRVHRVVPVANQAQYELDLAVKIIPKDRIINLQDYMTLKQEARMMALLGGTLNVVHFFGAYEDDESVYFVMERCVGGDAADRLDQDVDGHDEQLVAMYMTDILHVVWQCHQLRILHGDLKLENFLFADEKRDSPLKLTDFGGASFIGDCEKTSKLRGVRGTPLYTAPEVLQSEYSFPSDLWSCGVILYRLLAGRFPFEGGELLDERILHEAIDLESDPWPSISPDAKNLVHRLLERNPEKRLTAEAALRHPWLSQAEHQHHEGALQNAMAPPLLNGTMVQRLQFYRTLNGFQQRVLVEIARQLPVEWKQDVVVLFGEIAITNCSSGVCRPVVGIDEFATCLAKGGYTLTHGEVKSFLSRLDLDGDDFLAQDEFAAAFLDWHKIQQSIVPSWWWNQTVNRLFDAFDQDRDGKLCQADLAQVATTSSSHSFRNDLMRCLNPETNDCIQREDFHHMLRIPPHAFAHYAKRIAKKT